MKSVKEISSILERIENLKEQIEELNNASKKCTSKVEKIRYQDSVNNLKKIIKTLKKEIVK